MGKMISGTFNGTGAALYLCFGFVPDFVDIYASEDAELAHAHWNCGFTAAESVEGFIEHGGDQTTVLYTAGTGIRPYVGGDLMTTSNQTSVTYGSGVYLVKDDTDYRGTDLAAGALTIDTWTLDTSANRSGHFNEDVAGTYIGEGSKIKIDNRWYVIESVTGGAGGASDEVVLNYAAPSGEVQCITGMYEYIPLARGKVAPAGFYLAATTEINVSGQINMFVAGTYDN
jgi:hypothetical protein